MTVFLGAVVRRPVVVGVIFIYGWQTVALSEPLGFRVKRGSDGASPSRGGSPLAKEFGANLCDSVAV